MLVGIDRDVLAEVARIGAEPREGRFDRGEHVGHERLGGEQPARDLGLAEIARERVGEPERRRAFEHAGRERGEVGDAEAAHQLRRERDVRGSAEARLVRDVRFDRSVQASRPGGLRLHLRQHRNPENAVGVLVKREFVERWRRQLVGCDEKGMRRERGTLRGELGEDGFGVLLEMNAHSFHNRSYARVCKKFFHHP
jgi:hypothetical protein